MTTHKSSSIVRRSRPAFTTIPVKLFEALEWGDVSIAAPTLYALLGTYADNTTHNAYPGQKRLAEQMGLTDRHIRRLLAELKKTGWLEVRRRRNKTNIYTLRDKPRRQSANPRN